MAKRQTIWLSTMMILSLMVIGYYTVDETLKPVPTTTNENTKQGEQSKDNPPKANDKKENEKAQDDKHAMTGEDWFAEQFMKREVDYAKRVEQLQQVIADTKASSDQKIKAEKDLQEITEFSQKTDNAENKVVAEGYSDALVVIDKNRVTVTIQAAELTKEQVAKIYSVVSKELNIPPAQIVVTNKQ